MDGRVCAESEIGRGSTFHFTAEFGVSTTPATTPRDAEPDLRGVRVLVVDDNATGRALWFPRC